jgi:hypothetical protein
LSNFQDWTYVKNGSICFAHHRLILDRSLIWSKPKYEPIRISNSVQFGTKDEGDRSEKSVLESAL